ncbi:MULTISPECIES: MbtH family protein [Pseudomonas syringae group]|uniref:MbtH-like protein n=1 Tax=Pseudomonas syringae pv. helianthi TaxID=251654 RepID=A0A0N8RPI8_9PSED|nr:MULTISPECIES: MbtH family NRPS accessory protein [Pseudomonas syringae group]KPX48511.1 MbtH-like protein [Pseudomonas syringae pv. helianthi]NAS98572.1 antibiotic synthesis protein MbtH [Pseudomonas syringae pv. actinidifoliorum]NAT24530.1 antibiotic synthesis protein MbtH [Pseudomonas syringae pv. actinidifoliorum]NAT36392.1 antibiotic synthesis protein MbtH [Pseudomonas syringae pv. actinidifoliorum]NAT66616.1 antibiotic synthesis protein MbtH [Pseudomonas syringae pv. actinidifoliorum]
MDSKSMYDVVINQQEQYSLWNNDRPVPGGWTSIGVAGPRDFCFDWIQSNWLDQRPKFLRDNIAPTKALSVGGL